MVHPLSGKVTTPKLNHSTAVTTVSVPPTTARPALFDSITENLTTALNLYYTPCLILLGIIGNLISIFVFYKTKLRLQSTSVYLTALAVSDTIFLLQLIPQWLNAIKFTDIFHRPGYCQFFAYMSYVTCSLSAWLVVAFTVERYVAVLYPLQRNVLCTVARARLVIFILIVIACVLNIPVIKFASASSTDCNLNYDYVVHAARFNIVDTVLSFTVPLAVIVIMNMRIMIGMYSIERTRRQLMKTGGGRRRGRCLRNVPKLAPRAQHRVTKMLLGVSSVFVLLNMPAYTLRTLSYAYNLNANEHSSRWATMSQVALMFFNTNFGINFILYCLIGRNFRQSLYQSIPWFRNRSRRAAAVMRTSCHPARASSLSTSFASGTDMNSNCVACVSNITTGNNVRRHRSDGFIPHWGLHNSRLRSSATNARVGNDIEMTDFGTVNSSNTLM